jgi:hypothetical protein
MFPTRNVIIQLAGGLGNNLFQLYGAFGIAKRYPFSIKIDANRLHPHLNSHRHEKSQIRKIDLMQFRELRALNIPIVSRSKILTPNLIFRRLPLQRFIRVWSPDEYKLGNVVGAPLPQIDFFGLLETRIMGNFQDPSLVKSGIEMGLPEVLTPITPGVDYPKLHQKVIQSSVATIHIRLGDYLSAPSFLRLGIHYYHSFLEESLSLGVQQCVIFSDSPDLAAFFVKPFADKVDLEIIDPNSVNNVDALALMSKATHLCISNSSLSFFAAILNTNGRIVAPTPWFKGRYPDYNKVDLKYPHRWTVKPW